MGYKNMANGELEKENRKLMAQKVEIRGKQKEIQTIYSQRLVEQKVQETIDSMSSDEKKVLKQVLSDVGGIESQESVEGIQ